MSNDITDSATKTMRLSGLQKEVLALYRQCLRECRRKPQVCINLGIFFFKRMIFVIWLTWLKQSTRAHFEKFVR